jgi:hypothetical protein
MDENWCRWALGVSKMKMSIMYDKYMDFKFWSSSANRSWMEANFPDFTNQDLGFYNKGYFAALDEVKEAIGLNEFNKLLQKLDPDAS